jgi:hypothetical protein
MQVVLDEAKNSYRDEIIHSLISDSVEQMEENVLKAQRLIEQWILDRQNTIAQ